MKNKLKDSFVTVILINYSKMVIVFRIMLLAIQHGERMIINRQRVKEQFAAYTRNYDPTEPKIALKIIHTYKVADNCERIAKSLGLSGDMIDFCWLSGMLHDAGRFEQIKRYNTFIDSQSVDHAEFGADLLFGRGNQTGNVESTNTRLIENYIDDRSMDDVMDIVIRQHNKFKVSDTLPENTTMLCNILRDADKIDIFRVVVETPLEDLYGFPEDELLTSGVSDRVMSQVREKHAVLREGKTTPADYRLSHIALAFELVFPESKTIVREQGNLDKMFDFPTRNRETHDALEELRGLILQ